MNPKPSKRTGGPLPFNERLASMHVKVFRADLEAAAAYCADRGFKLSALVRAWFRQAVRERTLGTNAVDKPEV